MEETEALRAARAMRRAMLGDAYVDPMTADPDPVAVEFQDYVTSMAWGVWTRGGALSPRDRSLLVMAMTAALGRMEEFRLHVGSQARTGVTDEEIDELLFQIAAYCGAPAGIAARRSIKAVRADREVSPDPSGPAAVQTVAGLLGEAGLAFVDAPVSGGVAGARARTLVVMYAATDDACARVEPVLAGLSRRVWRVGNRPGLAQVMKLANNFLSATALAATSEAVAFGLSAGLDLATMLEVLDASSGHNTATSDKFPNHVLTGTYASSFSNTLMHKDVDLYRRAVAEQGGPARIGAVTAEVWERFAAAEPGADFTRIFPFVESS